MKHRRQLHAKNVAAFVVAANCWLTCNAAEPPTGTLAAGIQTANGNYLTMVDGGGLGGTDSGPAAVALRTDATAAGPSETFTIVWLDTKFRRFALQTSGGNYVTAVNGGGVGGPNDSSSPVHTDATRMAAWETLKLNFLPNNQVTINMPNGRYLSAVNGGGIKGTDAAPIRTDAVRHAAWEAFTLVKWDTRAHIPIAPAPAPAADDDPKLTRAERAVITQHFGKHLPYHVDISRSSRFPEVLRLMQYIDDAGFRPIAIMVDGAWLEGEDLNNSWMPREVTRRILQARGWPTLDESGRKALALNWVEDSLPPGWDSQTTADGGHAPEISIENGDVIVRLWLIRRGTSIAGPRISRDSTATDYRFKPDGSMTEDDPTRRTAPPVR